MMDVYSFRNKNTGFRESVLMKSQPQSTVHRYREIEDPAGKLDLSGYKRGDR
jgi:hypothetical protein